MPGLTRRMPWRCAAAAAVLALAAGGLWAQTYSYDGINISLYPQPSRSDQAAHGYLEYRFEIANQTAEAHLVQIVLPHDASQGAQVRGAVSVGPGSASELFLYQPALGTYGSGAAVYVDGRRQRDDMPISTDRMPDQNRHSILCARGIPEELRRKMEDPAAPAGSGSAGAPSYPGAVHYHGGTITYSSGAESLVCLSELPVARWSPYWLGYSEYDFVVLSRRDLDEMPPAVWTAIREWTQCGGRLIVLDDPGQSSPWTPPAQWEDLAGAPSDGTAGRSYAAALGRCFVTTEGTFDWATYSKRSVGGGPWQNYTQEELDQHFQMVLRSKGSVQIMLMLLVPLAVVVGPVNLLVLARRNQRIWMLVTVPALSGIACLALLGYSLVSEGTKAWARTVELTVLDERTHTASSVGWLALYSPLSQGRGLRFDRQTEVTAGGLDGDPFSPSRDLRCLTDWTGEQHLASGWIKARVPAYFQLRKSAVRRERVSIVRGSDGGLSATNGLGAPISLLTVCGPDGTQYTCGELAAGQQGKLTAGKANAAGGWGMPQGLDLGEAETALEAELEQPEQPEQDAEQPQVARRAARVARADASSLFVEDWRFAPHRVKEAPERYLRPGTYVAILFAPVFLEMPLEKVDLRGSQTVVIGTLAEWPDEN